jgi:hypothetical protein
MSENPDQTPQYLRSAAKTDEARQLVEELAAPLLRRLANMSGNEGWKLADPAAATPARLAQIAADVAALTNRRTRAAAFSLSAPFPKPEWMTEAAYEHACQSGYRVNQRSNLWMSLANSLRSNLWMSLGVDSWSEIWTFFETEIHKSFLASFELGLPTTVPASLNEIQKTNLYKILLVSSFFCFGFAVVGERERTERLARVVEAFADGLIPHDWCQSEPELLIVLVA